MNILFVDDEIEKRRFAQAWFGSILGHNLTVCRSYLDAERILSLQDDHFDLLITDLSLRGGSKSGYNLIGNLWPTNLPAILTTAGVVHDDEFNRFFAESGHKHVIYVHKSILLTLDGAKEALLQINKLGFPQ